MNIQKIYRDRSEKEFSNSSTGYLNDYGWQSLRIREFNDAIKRNTIELINEGPLEGLYVGRYFKRNYTLSGKDVCRYLYMHNIKMYNEDEAKWEETGEYMAPADFLGNSRRYVEFSTSYKVIFNDRIENILVYMSTDQMGKSYKNAGNQIYIHESVYNDSEKLEEVMQENDLVHTVDGGINSIDDCSFIESESEYYRTDSHLVCWVSEYQEYMLRRDCTWSDRLSDFIYNDTENYIYCEDVDDYEHTDNVYYSESDCTYYAERPSGPEYICEYHRSPDAKTVYNPNPNSHKYSIGFEVEKNYIDGKKEVGDHIGDYKFFAGFETDASCGVEGVSNIYCLQHGYDTLLDHTKEAKDILDEKDVDSDCGGHINVSGPSDIVNLCNVRKYAGLLFAMYRYRLQKSYSSSNKKMHEYDKRVKYSAIREKNDYVGIDRTLVEFRLISRVEHSNQILFRYKLIQRLIQGIEKGLSFEEYLNSNQPLLKSIYSEEKLYRINSMAISFNTWINADGFEEGEEGIRKFI